MAIDPSMASQNRSEAETPRPGDASRANAGQSDARQNVRVKPASIDAADQRVSRMVSVARFMDNAFVIPGLGVRVGWDAVLGLAPGVGDAAGAMAALYIINEARRMGAPRKILAMMLANVAIDTVIGAVPAIGDLIDAAFKANIRNLRLMGVTMDQDGHTWDRPAWVKPNV